MHKSHGDRISEEFVRAVYYARLLNHIWPRLQKSPEWLAGLASNAELTLYRVVFNDTDSKFEVRNINEN